MGAIGGETRTLWHRAIGVDVEADSIPSVAGVGAQVRQTTENLSKVLRTRGFRLMMAHVVVLVLCVRDGGDETLAMWMQSIRKSH